MFQRNERERAEENVFGEGSSYTLSDFLNLGEGILAEEKASAYLRYAEKSGKSFQSVARVLYCALRDGLPSASEAGRYLTAGDFYLDRNSSFHFLEGINPEKEMKEVILSVHEIAEGSRQGDVPVTRVEIDPQGSRITAITEVNDPDERCWVDREIASLDDEGRIYKVDDVFTPIEAGELQPSDRYTEIYTEDGEKVTMEQSGMGNYEAVSARVYSEEGNLMREVKIPLPEGGTIDQINTGQVISAITLPEETPGDEPELSDEELEDLLWQQDSDMPDLSYADLSVFEI